MKIVILIHLFVAMALLSVPLGAQSDRPNPYSTRARPDVEVVAFTVRPYGMEPKEVVTTEGPVLVRVYNRAGADEINLIVDSDKEVKRAEGVPDRLAEKRFERKQPSSNDRFDLLPGDYVIRDRDNPKWSARLVVLPASKR